MIIQQKNTVLIKIGGSILNDTHLMVALCADIRYIINEGYTPIVVHGGGKAISEALTLHGISSEFIDGLRVTSASAMQIIENVLSGDINPSLVRALNQTGVVAVGVSGVENHLFECEHYSKQHGYVGEIKETHPSVLQHLLSFKTLVPVITPLGVNKKGQVFNINADMAAYHLARALQVKQVLYLTDQDGIYDKQGKLLSLLSSAHLTHLINQAAVTGGMLVKARAILASLAAGLKQIAVLNGKRPEILADVLVHGKKTGTWFYPNQEEMPWLI